ncbi:MAG: TVP38/TMEM64 family protein [Halanaeroarchaeum sp.]
MASWPGCPALSTDGHRRLRLLVAALVLVAVGSVLLAAVGERLVEPVALRAWVADFGVFAPVVLVAVQALQVVVAPIPGQVLGLVAGYLFGPFYGTLYSVTGAAIGSFVAFALARRFGRPWVVDVVDSETMAWFDDLSDRRGYLALFLVFLVPGLPDDLLCLLAGMTRMNVWKMTVVSFVGRLPGYYVVAVGGAAVASAN